MTSNLGPNFADPDLALFVLGTMETRIDEHCAPDHSAPIKPQPKHGNVEISNICGGAHSPETPCHHFDDQVQKSEPPCRPTPQVSGSSRAGCTRAPARNAPARAVLGWERLHRRPQDRNTPRYRRHPGAHKVAATCDFGRFGVWSRVGLGEDLGSIRGRGWGPAGVQLRLLRGRTWARSGLRLWSLWGPCGVDLWGRSGAGFGSMWGAMSKVGVDEGSMWARSGSDPGWIWGRLSM